VSEERGRLQTLEENWARRRTGFADLEIRAKLRGAGQRLSMPRRVMPSRWRRRRKRRGDCAGKFVAGEEGCAAGGFTEASDEAGGFAGRSPDDLPSVDAQAISSVVADWTGIPVGRMSRTKLNRC